MKVKCQKCSNPAVVHLTEVISDGDGVKRAVEIHLCVSHAVEAGLVAPGSEILPQISGKLAPQETTEIISLSSVAHEESGIRAGP